MVAIPIGFWKSTDEPQLPDVRVFVDPTWDHYERERCVRYLRRGRVLNQWKGDSLCRFCGAANGSADLTDDVYFWPEGLAHYLTAHAVRLPQTFVDHVHTARRTPWPGGRP